MTERPGVVDALSEQVLAEAALLALEGVGERLQRAVVGPAKHAAAAAVVEQRVDGLLEHALLVADDDVGRLELHELLEAVVAVDDPTVEIVEVAGGEAAAVERNERTKLRRDDRDDVQDHPLGTVVRLAERLDDLEALGELQLLLQRGLGLHRLAQVFRELLDLDPTQQLLDRLRAHLGGELALVLLAHLPVALFREELLLLQRRVAGIDDDIGLEVEHPLEIAQRHVQQVSDPARQPLEEPHVGHGAGELDVREALTAHLRLGDLDAALVADHAPVLHALVLAAEALPVGDRAEDLRTEQTVPLRLEGAVVDRLRLQNLTVRPGTNLLRGGETDLDGVEIHHQVSFIAKSSERFQIVPPLLRSKT